MKASRTGKRGRFAWAVVAVADTAAPPEAALGSEAEVTGGFPSPTSTLTVTAGPGERNAVTVSLDDQANDGGPDERDTVVVRAGERYLARARPPR